jgi:hypothetical protein
MTIKPHLTGLLFSCCAIALCHCSHTEQHAQDTNWTKADSLTETYLTLQDSLLQAWNVMVHDDNKKLKAMHNLLHEVKLTSPGEQEILRDFEERLDQLSRMRYTQESMANAGVVEEYDFASNSLVSELIALTESRKEFEYNSTLQKLVDEIIGADQRVSNYRYNYDLIARQFNAFLEENKNGLKEMDQDALTRKPLFQMTAEE